ncbi:uncharacterized protein METZ01_LOCUS77343 [marine metagenome]|uniref:Uncharacterized protein n=1 Tax=marine metagenome TaxID=408172 RepID=A0A381U8L7_9ZZZZ
MLFAAVRSACLLGDQTQATLNLIRDRRRGAARTSGSP